MQVNKQINKSFNNPETLIKINNITVENFNINEFNEILSSIDRPFNAA